MPKYTLIFTAFAAFCVEFGAGKPANNFKSIETCVNKFCPIGTYCETRDVVKCGNPPCRPLFMCLPDIENGCHNVKCEGGTVCIERTVPCIGRSCKKVARCTQPGTCEALECPPSHRCETHPSPHCVRGIFTISEVAQLSQQQS